MVRSDGVGGILQFFRGLSGKASQRAALEPRHARAEGVSHVDIGRKSILDREDKSTNTQRGCLACWRVGRMARIDKLDNERAIDQ